MKPRILLVEDEKTLLQKLIDELTSKGFYVAGLSDGPKALELLKREKFDLLLTDIHMPDIGGIELMRKARQGDSDLPVILMTGHADLETTIDLLNMGAEGLLRKPVVIEELVKKIEQCLKKKLLARALLQSAKMAGLGEMTAFVMHELRNALTETSLAVSLMIRLPASSQKQKRYFEIMNSGIDRAEKVINHLLNFSRSSDRKKAVKLGRLLDTLLVLLEDRIKLQSISLERQISNLEIEGVADSLNIIFLNLLNNAIHSMEHGGGTLKISAWKNGQTVVTISDTGCGIPPEIQKDIFNAYFTTKGEKGSGIGLALVKREVEKMGGEIRVESEVGKGTTFSVILPAKCLENDNASTHHLPFV